MSIMYQGRIIRVKGNTNVQKLLYEMKMGMIHIMILMKRWMMLRKWKDKIVSVEIEGLEKCDDAGEGSEVSITENINDGPSLDECKVPPRCNKVKTRLLKSVRQVIMMEVKPIMI